MKSSVPRSLGADLWQIQKEDLPKNADHKPRTGEGLPSSVSEIISSSRGRTMDWFLGEHVYIYAHMYVCVHVCIYSCVYECMCTCVYSLCVCVWMHVCVYMCVFVCVYLCVYVLCLCMIVLLGKGLKDEVYFIWKTRMHTHTHSRTQKHSRRDWLWL